MTTVINRIGRILFFILCVLLLSIVFYGLEFPVNDYSGCYQNRDNTKRICINPDYSFQQYSKLDGMWKLKNQSNWTHTRMKDVSGSFDILTVKVVRIDSDKILPNVAVQPYKDALGTVKVAISGETYMKS